MGSHFNERESDTPASFAVVTEALTKSFDNQPAVRSIDVRVQVASITALLGPNGAGKTTTLEMISGLQRPDSGRVTVLGEVPWQADANHRARVGVMLQGGGVWSTATAEQAVRNVARFYRDPEDPNDLLERLCLNAKQRATPYRRLSGGEQQRVKMACAIVGRPALAILDEPSSGLDPRTRREIWSIIEDLRTRGTTVLLSTHSMEEAESLADEVVIMSGGRVVLAGPPKTLTKPTDSQNLTFTVDGPINVEELLADMPPGFTLTRDPNGPYRLTGAPVTPRTVALLTAWCADRGLMATDLRIGTRTLEDVFLEVTNS